MSYEKQVFCKRLDCGERISSTGWCAVTALVRKMHLQDKCWLMMCRKDLQTQAEPPCFHGMGNGVGKSLSGEAGGDPSPQGILMTPEKNTDLSRKMDIPGDCGSLVSLPDQAREIRQHTG